MLNKTDMEEKKLYMTIYKKSNGDELRGAEYAFNLCSAMVIASIRLADDLKKFEYERVDVYEASKFYVDENL